LNMKETYSTCIQTMARLETILDKIELILDGYEPDKESKHKMDMNQTKTVDIKR
jgi:hypothetical protein